MFNQCMSVLNLIFLENRMKHQAFILKIHDTSAGVFGLVQTLHSAVVWLQGIHTDTFRLYFEHFVINVRFNFRCGETEPIVSCLLTARRA